MNLQNPNWYAKCRAIGNFYAGTIELGKTEI